MRQTRQRDLILRVVCTYPGHPSLQDVYRAARQQMPRIGLATVYRHLERLAREGVVRKVVLGDRVTRYDTNIGKHYHIRCVECGRIDDLPMSFMDSINERISQSVGYQVLEHFLEVVGRCPACYRVVRGEHKAVGQ